MVNYSNAGLRVLRGVIACTYCVLRKIYIHYNRTLWSLVRIKEGVLEVKVYGSRHPMSKRTWDIGGGEDPKRETNKWSAPALDSGRWRRSGTWNLAVLGTGRCMGFVRQIYLLLNIKLLKCCHFCWECSTHRYNYLS